ncbi:hydroxyacid dehydrogenase (plasmid) [Paracoccus liaowanqingii]|uniref:Hydroxyacid dehydrogenase n=1 Tax=Paracoccus liaowanqingii TaxID=2560053 RepID=A0A4Y5SQS8_9RHOB|nr:NAD(P)-dependent oxidoreductase [Paracoccus liaowanqingii]QDA35847.1 hydroxyacid dehydrogenase [Paracoccus liaowanqingii]
MTTSLEPIAGVYLCDMLDLETLFAPSLARLPQLRMYRPDAVPDAAEIRLAIAYRPAQAAFLPFSRLQLVQSIAAGVDGILGNPSLPPDIPVARVRDPEQAAIMAGFAVWHVIWHHRRMGHYLKAAQAYRWDRISFAGLKAPSATVVGVLGYGTMGRAVAEAVAQLGFDVRAATLTPRQDQGAIPLITGPHAPRRLAAQCDIVINLLPLTPDTRSMIDAGFLAAMPQGAVLIHLGRGEQLVEPALLDMLDRGHLSGASLDVFATEPLPADHPFWNHPNVVVTPHEASVLPASAVVDALERSLADLRAGVTPRTAVDRIKGY